jgi:hypothetical protein
MAPMGALFLNDADRVAALRSYNILDSVPEPAYEEITKLASQVCEPVATIGLGMFKPAIIRP